MIKPWPRRSSETLADCRIFSLRKDVVVSPRTRQPHAMYVLEHPDWVNIIPVTADDQVVLVRQWRHGTRAVELETPGGLLDPGETPATCAQRELLEETGYQSTSISLLGEVRPNPAIQANKLFYVLAEGCEKIAEPALDHAEDIAVELVPRADLPQLVASGQIRHSIVIAGFYWWQLRRAGLPTEPATP